MTSDRKRKRGIRERMERTGENYMTAARSIEEARTIDPAQARIDERGDDGR